MVAALAMAAVPALVTPKALVSSLASAGPPQEPPSSDRAKVLWWRSALGTQGVAGGGDIEGTSKAKVYTTAYDRAQQAEYARVLGVNPEVEAKVFAVVRQALEMPLPTPWRECVDARRRVFFWNAISCESSWVHPMRGTHEALIQAHRRVLDASDPVAIACIEIEGCKRQGEAELALWREVASDNGRPYYYHVKTKVTRWDNPREELSNQLCYQAHMLATLVAPMVDKHDGQGSVQTLRFDVPSSAPASPSLGYKGVSAATDELTPAVLRAAIRKFKDDDDQDCLRQLAMQEAPHLRVKAAQARPPPDLESPVELEAAKKLKEDLTPEANDNNCAMTAPLVASPAETAEFSSSSPHPPPQLAEASRASAGSSCDKAAAPFSARSCSCIESRPGTACEEYGGWLPVDELSVRLGLRFSDPIDRAAFQLLRPLLVTPPPAPWSKWSNESGRHGYRQPELEGTCWSSPLEPYFAQLLQLLRTALTQKEHGRPASLLELLVAEVFREASPEALRQRFGSWEEAIEGQFILREESVISHVALRSFGILGAIQTGDPREMVASELKARLGVLRELWVGAAGGVAFPFEDAQLVSLSSVLAGAVVHSPSWEVPSPQLDEITGISDEEIQRVTPEVQGVLGTVYGRALVAAARGLEEAQEFPLCQAIVVGTSECFLQASYETEGFDSESGSDYENDFDDHAEDDYEEDGVAEDEDADMETVEKDANDSPEDAVAQLAKAKAELEPTMAAATLAELKSSQVRMRHLVEEPEEEQEKKDDDEAPSFAELDDLIDALARPKESVAEDASREAVETDAGHALPVSSVDTIGYFMEAVVDRDAGSARCLNPTSGSTFDSFVPPSTANTGNVKLPPLMAMPSWSAAMALTSARSSPGRRSLGLPSSRRWRGLGSTLWSASVGSASARPASAGSPASSVPAFLSGLFLSGIAGGLAASSASDASAPLSTATPPTMPTIAPGDELPRPLTPLRPPAMPTISGQPRPLTPMVLPVVSEDTCVAPEIMTFPCAATEQFPCGLDEAEAAFDSMIAQGSEVLGSPASSVCSSVLRAGGARTVCSMASTTCASRPSTACSSPSTREATHITDTAGVKVADSPSPAVTRAMRPLKPSREPREGRCTFRRPCVPGGDERQPSATSGASEVPPTHALLQDTSQSSCPLSPQLSAGSTSQSLCQEFQMLTTSELSVPHASKSISSRLSAKSLSQSPSSPVILSSSRSLSSILRPPRPLSPRQTLFDAREVHSAISPAASTTAASPAASSVSTSPSKRGRPSPLSRAGAAEAALASMMAAREVIDTNPAVAERQRKRAEFPSEQKKSAGFCSSPDLETYSSYQQEAIYAGKEQISRSKRFRRSAPKHQISDKSSGRRPSDTNVSAAGQAKDAHRRRALELWDTVKHRFAAAGAHGFKDLPALQDGVSFFVACHNSSGNVQGRAFATFEQASELFGLKKGGPFAVMLMSTSFHELQYYGSHASFIVEDFRTWWWSQRQPVDHRCKRKGVKAVVAAFASAKSKKKEANLGQLSRAFEPPARRAAEALKNGGTQGGKMYGAYANIFEGLVSDKPLRSLGQNQPPGHLRSQGAKGMELPVIPPKANVAATGSGAWLMAPVASASRASSRSRSQPGGKLARQHGILTRAGLNEISPPNLPSLGDALSKTGAHCAVGNRELGTRLKHALPQIAPAMKESRSCPTLQGRAAGSKMAKSPLPPMPNPLLQQI